MELDPREGLVSDCYALNVAAEEVLACPYTDFPVLRIADGRHRTFPAEAASGVTGIVACGDRIGLIGGHRDPSLLVLGDIHDGRFVESTRARLLGPDGSDLPPWQVHCRGPVAHFFVGAEWFSLSLDELA